MPEFMKRYETHDDATEGVDSSNRLSARKVALTNAVVAMASPSKANLVAMAKHYATFPGGENVTAGWARFGFRKFVLDAVRSSSSGKSVVRTDVIEGDMDVVMSPSFNFATEGLVVEAFEDAIRILTEGTADVADGTRDRVLQQMGL